VIHHYLKCAENVLNDYNSGFMSLSDFHRQHPEIEKFCIESDIKLRKTLDEGEPFVIYE